MSHTILHIGFPKTATTTLQSVLMACPDCHYLGKGLRDTMEPSLSLDVTRAVIFADKRRFEDAAPSLVEQLTALMSERRCLVVSDEAFSFGEHMKIGRQWDRQVVTDHRIIAARLARLCPEARIVMSVRNQMSFLTSFFRQSIKGDGFTGSFDNYITREIGALSTRSMLHLLRYDEAFCAYSELFGTSNVMVSLYENYVADFGAYLDQVAQFCGLDAAALRDIWRGRHDNKAKKVQPRQEVEKLISLVPPILRKAIPDGPKRALKRKAAKLPSPTDFTPAQTATLQSWFAASNQAFSKTTGLDLGMYDYPGMTSGQSMNRGAL